MTTVYAVTNQKGGVGKTTTSVNLAASLAATQRRILLIDLDPQGNATVGSGVNKRELDISCLDVLLGNENAEAAIVKPENANYSVLPANDSLTIAEVELLNLEQREYRLKNALESIKSLYEFIIIDSPPSLNMLTVNALVAADGVIIPTQCEYYALEGISALMGTVERIQQAANPDLQVAGLLRTMFDPRNNLANDVSAELISHFGERVYRTIIPRNVTLAEAPSYGLPVLQYDKSSRGALAYLALAGEILRKSTEIVEMNNSQNEEKMLPEAS